jgi:esterase/lipase superfamily enzyme
VLFVSGDCDQDWFEQGAWGGLVIDYRAERFTNYYSTLDQVLDLSGSIIHGEPRAGHDGLPASVPAKFHDVYCGQQYIDKVPDAEKGRVRSHTWYFDDAGFYRDVALTLDGQTPASMPTRRPVQGSSDLALLT